MIQDETKPKKRGRPKKPATVMVKNTSGKVLHGYNNDLIQPGETYPFEKPVAEMLLNRNMVERAHATGTTKK